MSGCAPHKQCIDTRTVLTCSVPVCQHVPLYPQGGSATFLQTCTGLGRIVMAEVQMMKLKKENRKEWERLQTNNTKMHLVGSGSSSPSPVPRVAARSMPVLLLVVVACCVLLLLLSLLLSLLLPR
jgi:hypothetical protein